MVVAYACENVGQKQDVANRGFACLNALANFFRWNPQSITQFVDAKFFLVVEELVNAPAGSARLAYVRRARFDGARAVVRDLARGADARFLRLGFDGRFGISA